MEIDDRTLFGRHREAGFLAPTDLQVTPLKLRRIALIGSCQMEALNFHLTSPDGCEVEVIPVNHYADLPRLTPEAVRRFDLQLVQLPLRVIMTDAGLWHLDASDEAGHQAALDRSAAIMRTVLDLRMAWNAAHGLLTLVCNFVLPQNNPLGRFARTHSLSNPEYFVDRLNALLEAELARYKTAYMLNVDRIAASIGRRYIQDDSVLQIAHGSLLDPAGPLGNRMEPVAAVAEYYDLAPMETFRAALWAEMAAMHRTVAQADMVKLVLVDLDDTLWNGVSGELDEVSPFIIEGWPLGLAEALVYLKKRGVLLAIVSKNDEERVRETFPRIFGDKLRLDDFAAVRINWEPKSENVRQVLAGMNLLPGNAVFIDDNPAERAAMAHAFPDMRIMGRHIYYLRRILLWSAECQTVGITDESSRRTTMMQSQLRREDERKDLSREDFLAAAAPRAALLKIGDTAHPRFGRVLELINKTNQFNTTGRRWTARECAELLAGGGHIVAFEVQDSYTAYGLVGVVLLRGAAVEQWVMSCRVLGYRVEQAVMAALVRRLRAGGATEIVAGLVETRANFPCRDLWADCGFRREGEAWVLPAGVDVAVPAYLAGAVDELVEEAIPLSTADFTGLRIEDRDGHALGDVAVVSGHLKARVGYMAVEFAFELPPGDAAPALVWQSFVANDRAAMFLNGVAVGGAGILSAGRGTIQCAPGLEHRPFTFAPNGGTGRAEGPFVAGVNRLLLVVNKTDSGTSGEVIEDLADAARPRDTTLLFQGMVTVRRPLELGLAMQKAP